MRNISTWGCDKRMFQCVWQNSSFMLGNRQALQNDSNKWKKNNNTVLPPSMKFVILEEKTASNSSCTVKSFSNPPLCLATPLHLKIYFLLTREELLLILPWNSGQYSSSVLGYLIKSQYARLSAASTSGNDFAQGRVRACVRVRASLEMNCFCLFHIDCGTALHIHHGAPSHTASSASVTLMNQKLWLEDSEAC